MYAWEALHDTPIARRIHAALHNEPAFTAYLRSLPDGMIFDADSPSRGPVAQYLRALYLGPVDVYRDVAAWEEGRIYNTCLLPQEVAQFVAAFRGSDRTVKTAREVWARVTAPAAE
jgi:hypothetical protein